MYSEDPQARSGKAVEPSEYIALGARLHRAETGQWLTDWAGICALKIEVL